MDYSEILLTALLALCMAELLVIWFTLRRMLEKLREEVQEPEEEAAGMDLLLLKPKPKHKAHRFTDKSRDWITAKETASRR